MLRLFPSEEFKEINFEIPPKVRYAISNYGRVIKFTESIDDGQLAKPSMVNGYQMLYYTVVIDGKAKKKSRPYYKLVAEYFLERPSEDYVHVIHLDRSRGNDHVSNLRWVTYEEKIEHFKSSPALKAAMKKLWERNTLSDGRKLTVTQVMLLKKRLLDPNRKTRLKILAKQFGVSEMQLHRIKTGENWGHIKV
jgi:hypothetical protein